MFFEHHVVSDAGLLSEAAVKLPVVVAFDPPVLFWVAMPLVDHKVTRKNKETVAGKKELIEASRLVGSVA